jgi:hypothetical protein
MEAIVARHLCVVREALAAANLSGDAVDGMPAPDTATACI